MRNQNSRPTSASAELMHSLRSDDGLSGCCGQAGAIPSKPCVVAPGHSECTGYAVWPRSGTINATGSADVENTDWPHIRVAMPNSGDRSRSKPLRSISDYTSTCATLRFKAQVFRRRLARRCPRHDFHGELSVTEAQLWNAILRQDNCGNLSEKERDDPWGS
jgi:hypothetical protein